jgi:predicted CopG family antitoxin
MSQSSVAEEYCQTHGDLFVAFDKKRNELVCNQCIYAEVEDVEKAFEQLTFTSYVASNLKDLFDEKFNAYRQGLAQMNQIAPQQISQQLEHTVSHFFETVDNQIKEVEQSVLAKIQASTNLSELENLLMKEKNSFGIDFEKLYDNNRQEIEGFVQKGCYSSVVNKKDAYETLIKQMKANNESMSKVVSESQQKIEKIMTIKKENEANLVIGKRLHEIVDSCLEIDIRKDEIPHFKRQKTDTEENVLTQA